jgi:hypothetical protein
LLNKEVVVSEETKFCKVESLGKTKLVFSLNLPKQLGKYQVEAALLQADNEPIRSLRDFQLKERIEHLPSKSSIKKF